MYFSQKIPADKIWCQSKTSDPENAYSPEILNWMMRGVFVRSLTLLHDPAASDSAPLICQKTESGFSETGKIQTWSQKSVSCQNSDSGKNPAPCWEFSDQDQRWRWSEWLWDPGLSRIEPSLSGWLELHVLFDHLLDLFSLPPTAIHGLEFPG